MTTVRLRNTVTGVVVQVREGKAGLLGYGWESADAPTKPAPKRTSKSEQ